MACDDAEIENLLQWMKDKYQANMLTSSITSLSFLKPTNFKTTGRGLKAMKPFHNGDSIVAISKDLMVSCSDVIRNSSISTALSSSGLHFSACELLAIFVLYHSKRKRESIWWPYIESLPKVFYIPTKEEVTLYPSFIQSHLLDFLVILDKAQIKITKVFQALQSEVSVDDIIWAYMAVNSRTVYMEDKDKCSFLTANEKGNCALAPFLDLLNHSFNANISIDTSTEGMYKIITHVPYDVNDQVFINYGPHDNIKLFVEYGFFIPNNPHDGIPVTVDDIYVMIMQLDLPQSLTNSLDEKKAIVASIGESQNLFIAQDGPSWLLETVATVLLLPAEEIPSWQNVYCRETITKPVKLLLLRLMQKMASSISDCLTVMNNVSNKSEHLQIGCSLVLEYLSLVRQCIKNFTDANI